MAMPIVCVRIPHFALRAAVLRHPHLDGSPLLLATSGQDRPLVLDASPEARRAGIRAGLTVREAQMLCPIVIVLPEHPIHEAELVRQVLTRFLDLSPLVEADEAEPGCWYISLTGLERRYGSHIQAARHFLRSVPAVLHPRASVAPAKFVARVAAGASEGDAIRVVAPSEVRSFLHDASISWLPVPPPLITEMRQLGLATLGMLAALDRKRALARFGKPGVFAWELANGIDHRQVVPPPLVPTVTETTEMPVPAVSRDMLMAALRHLVHRAFQHPDLHGRYVRTVTIRAALESRESWERALTLKEPADAYRLVHSLTLRLDTLEMPGPVTHLTIELGGIIANGARQEVLPTFRHRNDPSLHGATEQLKHRYGSSPLYRIVEVEPWSRIPERRHALMPYDP
jgi:DNA polymerase-4/protein ImuB